MAEADGALEYRTPADLFEEKRREDRMRDLGGEVVRYTWDEALRRPQVLAARLWRAFERSLRRLRFDASPALRYARRPRAYGSAGKCRR